MQLLGVFGNFRHSFLEKMSKTPPSGKRSSSKKESKLTVRLKKTKLPRRYQIQSWDGLETYRDRIHAIAHEICDVDELLRAKYEFVVVAGLTLAAVRDPSTTDDPLVLRAAQAQKDLRELTEYLTQKHGVEWHFIRREWALILCPTEEQKIICERNVRKFARAIDRRVIPEEKPK